MQPESDYYVDHSEKVLLRVTRELPVPSDYGPPGVLKQTKYPNLYLSEHHTDWSILQSDINMIEFVEARDD